ncbi:MAG: ImmA/IrrE family metallo-endopeptidase [Eubacteriales bacterium]|nr:ImmA/IrrE family metallo-endopeptidase [Eubacteriales bacterium]
MASAEYIRRITDELAERFGTRDPVEIAQGLNLLYYERADFRELLGMYAVVNDTGCIFVNGNLTGSTAQMIAAHELGHDRLHRTLAEDGAIWDFQYYDIAGRQEYEANAFAAQLLLTDEAVMEVLREGYTVTEAAGILGFDERLLLIKLNEMKKAGHHLNLSAVPSGDFLRQVRTTDRRMMQEEYYG